MPAARSINSLLIVTGPPGSGKTTVAQILAQRFEPSVLVEGDAFFHFLARGAIAPWLPESNAQNDVVIRAAASAAAKYRSAGYFTVFDGMVGPWFLGAFIAASRLDHVDYAILLPPVDQCIDRVQTRDDHDFADDGATSKMHAQFSGAEIDERHVFRDPPDDPEAVADLLLAALDDRRLAHP